MHLTKWSLWSIVAATLLTTGAGCELVASVDRGKIPAEGTGGSADGGTGGTGGVDAGTGGTGGATGGTGGEAGTGGAAGGTGGEAGTAGTGGTAGNAGTGGSAGGEGGTPCSVPSDCPDTGNECIANTCDNDVCGTELVADGTATATQTAGDCQVIQCDGAGDVKSVADDTDVPDDSNDCTTDTCNAGAPEHTNLTSGTACGTNGDLVCNDQGECVGCLAPEDCSGTDDECQTRTCTNTVCGMNYTAAGTAVASQTAGDCKQSVCDGSGHVGEVALTTDLPVDGNECTDDICTGSTPSNPPLSSGSACSAGGTVCNGSGTCVECVSPTTCTGTDTDCHQRTCIAGACGVDNTAANTPVTTQAAGDCKQDVCDGNGAVISSNLDTDLPDDNNVCTTDTCTSGAPGHTPVSQGTSCGTNGLCDANGQCLGCLAPSDCPGQDTECQTRSCTSGVCGFSYTAAGTATTSQTAGNCKKNQCDGAGAIVAANDDTDLPVDGNQCTDDVCTTGAPSNPPVASGTACTQNGTVCNSTGACVECLVASTCPGTDSECQTRTCTNNTCGFTFAAVGGAVTTQTAGDCHKDQCDGAGAVETVIDNADVPVDNKQCTGDVCTAGTPANPPLSSGTACTQNGGTMCNTTGDCVQCLVATTCPGTDGECQTKTCTNGACGMSYVTAGTATSTQSAGDCHENQCDGAGAIANNVWNTDVPADDGNQCTSEICTAGSPSHPPTAAGTTCNQGGGSVCDGSGACVTCAAGTDCPGSDTECQTRTCTSGVCGFSYIGTGIATTTQVTGDCQTRQCDGAGAFVQVATNTDVPADEGNQCTDEICTAGVASHPDKASGATCSQTGGIVCDGAGACVECVAASNCAGSDTECHVRTCNSFTCGVSNMPLGTLTSTQTPGDCEKNQCDGNGSPETVADDTDVPNDNNECTTDTCTGGVPSNTDTAAGSACTVGGTVCDGAGVCVACNVAADCGTDTLCQQFTCTGHVCGVVNTSAGIPVGTQTAGDCQQAECDGSGSPISVIDNGDVPVDTNDCTDNVCTGGVPSNPNSVLGTTCTSNGGTRCDGAGACVNPPTIVLITPADGASATAPTNIAVTFSKAMNATTLTGQTAAGACTGSVQVSLDGFASCVRFAAAAATMSGGNTVATFVPAPGLLYSTNYKVRVTTDAKDSVGLALATTFTQPAGFTTQAAAGCGTSVVISQVYGGGNNAGAVYDHDFIELHNRGPVAVDVSTWSVQYASSTGTSWTNRTNLTGSIPAGGYYLIQEGGGTTNGVPLPTPDVLGSIGMSGSAGKVALVSNQTALTGACPTLGVVDFVGFGSAADCFEGSGPTATLANPTAAIRAIDAQACTDTGNNGADFVVGTPLARNTTSPALVCGCAINESNTAPELDFCNVQFPTSIDVTTATQTPVIYAQAYEAGVTDPAGAAPGLIAQIGYGPTTSNPEYQAGWSWTNATFNTDVGNNDEWQAQLTAPAAGTYHYGARFSFDGLDWTYCDLNGAGANAGLSFETTQLPTMTVNQ